MKPQSIVAAEQNQIRTRTATEQLKSRYWAATLYSYSSLVYFEFDRTFIAIYFFVFRLSKLVELWLARIKGLGIPNQNDSKIN